jgi:hypothetical protein
MAMKKKELTVAFRSLPYLSTGQRCLLHSGAPRSEPHVDGKLSACEAIENESRYPEPIHSNDADISSVAATSADRKLSQQASADGKLEHIRNQLPKNIREIGRPTPT